MMRQFAMAVVLLAGEVSGIQAQLLEDARVGVSLHVTPPDSADRCRPNRIYSAAMGSIAGAGAGWLFFTLGIGALADDHGSEYKRERRKWVIGGAIIGTIVGIVRPEPLPGRHCPIRRIELGPELPLSPLTPSDPSTGARALSTSHSVSAGGLRRVLGRGAVAQVAAGAPVRPLPGTAHPAAPSRVDHR
jgi:hypothetical protein